MDIKLKYDSSFDKELSSNAYSVLSKFFVDPFDINFESDIKNELINNKIKPKFGESQDLHPKAIKWIDKVNTLYENCHKDFDYFCEEVNNTLPGWLNNYRGF